MEGVLALMIPIVAVGGFFAWMISLSPVGKAYAERLRGGSAAGGTPEDQVELVESVGGRTTFAVTIPDQPVRLDQARGGLRRPA